MLVVGALFGLLSWLVVRFGAGHFEPFDSGLGLVLNQLTLIVGLTCFSGRFRPSASIAFLVGAYGGMVAYAYMLGGSDHRAWITLGAVVTVGLLALPGLFAVVLALVLRRQRLAPDR